MNSGLEVSPASYQEENQSRKEFVLRTVRDIIHSGELLSSRTREPLTDTEKGEYLSRATFYFVQDERKWMCARSADSNDLSPAYNMIILLLKMEDRLSQTLKSTVQMICETPARDESEYERFLEEIRRKLLPQDNEPIPDEVHEQNLNEMQIIKKVWGHLQNNVWGYVSASPVGKAVISSAVDEIVLAFEGTIRPYNIASGVRCTAMVGGLYLCGTIGYNVYQAVRCGRSWKRAGKNILEELGAVTSGALAGIAVSALLAPLTGGISLICGAIFGIAANLGIRTVAKKYTVKLFNIPEDEMLEKAYATLDTNQLIENSGISRAYREKSRQFHPDKVYSRFPHATEEEKNRYMMRYLKVQAAFGMIMAARKNEVDEYDNARKQFERIEEDELLGKSRIDIHLRLWAVNQGRKLWSYFVETKDRFKYQITDGILPYEVFEEQEESYVVVEHPEESELEEAAAA